MGNAPLFERAGQGQKRSGSGDIRPGFVSERPGWPVTTSISIRRGRRRSSRREPLVARHVPLGRHLRPGPHTGRNRDQLRGWCRPRYGALGARSRNSLDAAPQGAGIGRLTSLLAALVLVFAALSQPVLASVVAPVEQCCSVAPSSAVVRTNMHHAVQRAILR